jgi:CRISPR-associated protein Cas2
MPRWNPAVGDRRYKLMPKSEFALSGYRAMWLFAMFDLPMDKPELRLEYTRFRRGLLKRGFTMLQYSVYAHYTASEESDETLRKKVQAALPPHGQVRLISITDRQFEKMEVYVGKKRHRVEDPPSQLMLF